MIAIRSLFFLICLPLLYACAEWPQVGSPCSGPGSPSAAHRNCWYHLTINTIDDVGNRVTGTDARGNRFTFRVRDVAMLKQTNQLTENQSYVFGSVSGSPYLELYTDTAITPDLKGTAEEK